MKIILTMLLSITTVMFAQDKPELPGWGFYVGGGSMGIVADDIGATWGRTVGVPILGISRGLWAGPVPLSVGAGLGKRGFTQEWTRFDDFFTGEEGESTKSETQFTTLDIWATVPYPVGPAVLQVGFVMGMSLSGTSNGRLALNNTADGGLAIEGDMLPNDLGLMLGLAYPINDNIGINVGYAHGLTNHSGYQFSLTNINFNGIFALVGYNF